MVKLLYLFQNMGHIHPEIEKMLSEKDAHNEALKLKNFMYGFHGDLCLYGIIPLH